MHLPVSEPNKAPLPIALQALKLSVSVQSKEGPFWQKRYYDFNVYTEDKRVEKLRYTHRNPVTRGLVGQPEDWRWSSFRHWWTGEIGAVAVESPWTARRRGGLGQSLADAPGMLQTHVSPLRHGLSLKEGCGPPAFVDHDRIEVRGCPTSRF